MLLKAEYFRAPDEFRQDQVQTVVWAKLPRRVRLRARSRQCRVAREQLFGDTRADTASARLPVSGRCAPQTRAYGQPQGRGARYSPLLPAPVCDIGPAGAPQ